MADFEGHHLLLAAIVEFEAGAQGVGRLLVVVEHEVAADGADFGGILHAQSPAGHVHLVNALVADVAVAVVPEPMPVVVKAVRRECVLRRRSQPQIVVHAGGHRLHRLAADGVAPFVAQAAGHVDIADQAFAQLLDYLAPDAGALLGAVLHDAVVLLRGGYDLPGLEHIVRARLLDVDILAGLAGPDRLQGVMVVGRGDGDGIDGLVFEQLAQIGERRGTLSLGFLDGGYPRR